MPWSQARAKGLSRRSQFLLWLLQHQPEVIEVVIEYEADDENGDELLDLSEDAELAEALLKTFLPQKMMPNSKQIGTSSKLRSTSRQVTTKQTENQRTVIEQLEWLRSIKANKKSLEKQEKEAIAELERMYESGLMEDSKDCGEERWEITGFTVQRIRKMGTWIHSPEAKLKIDAIQAEDIEQGLAKRKAPVEYFTTKITDRRCRVLGRWRSPSAGF